MNPFRKHVEELVEKAVKIHTREASISLDSVDIVGELERRNAGGYLLLDTKALARRIGLSPSQFWKRAQAARTLRRFPALRELAMNGRTSVSNIGLIAPKVTPANLKIILAELPGKSGREVKEFLTEISFAGRLPTAGTKGQEKDLLSHALAAAATRGRPASKRQLLNEALTLWLDEWDYPASLTKVI